MSIPVAIQDQKHLHLLRNVAIKPVFILGLNRSGTTILHHVLHGTGSFHAVTVYHILNRTRLLHLHLHPEEQEATRIALKRWFQEWGVQDRKFDRIAVGPDLPEEYGYALDYFGLTPKVTPENIGAFRQLLAKIQYISNADRPTILKNPWDTGNFLVLRQMFPNARFVFIHRNPVTVLSSQLRMFNSLIRTCSPYDMLIDAKYRSVCENPFLRAAMRIIYSDALRILFSRVFRNMALCCDYMVNHMEELGSLAMNITYPQFCAEPRERIRDILRFAGLEPGDPRLSQEIKPREQVLTRTVERMRKKIEARTRHYAERFGV